jgi:hypothetical protein
MFVPAIRPALRSGSRQRSAAVSDRQGDAVSSPAWAPTACGRSTCRAGCATIGRSSARTRGQITCQYHRLGRAWCAPGAASSVLMPAELAGAAGARDAGTLCGTATNNAAQNRIGERGCHWLAVGEQCRFRLYTPKDGAWQDHRNNQGQLAIQNRRHPRQAEETVPSVRVTRETRSKISYSAHLKRMWLMIT